MRQIIATNAVEIGEKAAPRRRADIPERTQTTMPLLCGVHRVFLPECQQARGVWCLRRNGERCQPLLSRQGMTNAANTSPGSLIATYQNGPCHINEPSFAEVTMLPGTTLPARAPVHRCPFHCTRPCPRAPVRERERD